MGDAIPNIKIGLEIHGYLDIPSNVKLFCNCLLLPAEPNTNICPVCTGQPGSKPMLPNKEAVEAILKIALFLACDLNKELLWQRKHYSWPDLPNGYQKTMSGAYSQPVGLNGTFLGIGIEEIHLEEDPARWDPVSGGVDYNRSGFPLVEIVTKPEFTSPAQVREWIENLMVALSYIKAVRKDLGVKCDVNVSIGPHFVRTEVKNVNSFTAIVEAIEYEVKRQREELAQKKAPQQQTRAWDDHSGTTLFMRSKETAQDYQFIPDPDLPVIHVTDAIVQPIRESLPERPDQKQTKFEKIGVPKDVAEKLSSNLIYANAADRLMQLLPASLAPFIADRFNNEIRGTIFNRQNNESRPLIRMEIFEREDYGEDILKSLVLSFHGRDIDNLSFKMYLTILDQQIERTIDDVRQQISKDLRTQTSNKQSDSDLSPLIKAAIATNPKAAADVKAGNDKAINAIVGHVLGALKKEGKSADPAVIQKLVREHL